MVDYVINNWKDISEAIAAIVGLASIIIRLTPTLKDNSFFLPLIKFIGKYIALDKYGVSEVKRPK